MNDVLKTLQKDLGIGVVSVPKSSNSLTTKQKLINSCNNEIKRLSERKSLNVSDSEKSVRFWKQHPTLTDKVLVNLKLKGKIFRFGSDYQRGNTFYLGMVDNNYNSVVDFIKQNVDWLESNTKDEDEIYNNF